MAKKRNIIVGQSGGPTAVINSSLAGVYKNAIENMFHVGSINFYVPSSSDHNSHRFYCIENVSQIYSIIQKAVIDIQTDIEYPNQLRPDENPGYNTQYRPK